MSTSKTPALRGLPARLTSIKNAAHTLKNNHYGVLRMLLTGELEGELVDGEPKVVIASMNRRIAEQQAAV
jgi:hypothetical protein